jgi:predicted RNA-binding protein with PIN domain
MKSTPLSRATLSRFRCLIDGYNLMFESVATPDPKLGKAALRQAREQLLDFVASRLSDSDRRTTWIVFDSDLDVAMPDEMLYRGMQISFAREESSADEYLCNWIRSHSRPSTLSVVSSDHQIQRAAKARGAKFFDSEQWVSQVLPEHPLSDSPLSETTAADRQQEMDEALRHTKLQEGEKKDWLKTFGYDKLG